MDAITKYIKKMLKDLDDMLDSMNMVKNPKAVSVLKTSISSLLIAAGGLYAGTQIHQAVNPEAKDTSVMLEDLEESDRIPSNNPMQSVDQKVVEEKSSEPMPMQSVDQKVVEEEQMQSMDQKVVEEKLSEPIQSLDQNFLADKPSELNQAKVWTSQKIFEHYKPGLSVGASCDITNKCSDKKREIEELIDVRQKIYRTTTYGLLCDRNSKCVEVLSGPVTSKYLGEEYSHLSLSPSKLNKYYEHYKLYKQKIFEHYKPGLSVGASCDITNKCSDKKRTVFQELADDAEKNTYTTVNYGLFCNNNQCVEEVEHKCKCSNKTRVVEEFIDIDGKTLHRITTYGFFCGKNYPGCVEDVKRLTGKTLEKKSSTSNSVGQR